MIHLTEEEVNMPWQPLVPGEAVALLSCADYPWWFAGGYAIEFFIGEHYREHEDLDILVLRSNLPMVKNSMKDWQLFASDPPGKLRLWDDSELLPAHVNDIWVRKDSTSPWSMQFMVNDHQDKDFLYKRDRSVHFPMDKFTRKNRDGWPYLAPELQLLHKAKSIRPKDQMDFERCLARLSEDSLSWLKQLLARCYSSEHLWIKQIDSRQFK
jgi:hypothetical protein